ncbi:SRPBCC family protein [Natrinema salifodinae]|uniref:Uncharacterized membrane protein n=1 Tax=Natrinema salifodinae TaxID=1202768 RepID=A0A1I0MBH9_9EURY|nr:SRPBCC family protein [Natrinema salifodinae]SEV85324.1 Uncharacterized membrane protein [Natrinema salifodinae]
MSDNVSNTAMDESRGGRPDSERSRPLGRGERLASASVGGMLLVAGIKRRSLGGVAMALGGGWLVARGISGSGRSLRAFGSGGETDHGAGEDGAGGDLTVERSITVGAPADDLAQYWRDPERLTRIMGSFAVITGAGEDRHHWEVETPRGPNLSWETEIVDDEPGEVLRWESVDGATIANEGTVRFRPAPGDRGTEVTLRLRFEPPGGAVGTAVAQRLGIVPKTLAGNALRRFKSLVETGEIPTLERNPSGRGSGDLV